MKGHVGYVSIMRIECGDGIVDHKEVMEYERFYPDARSMADDVVKRCRESGEVFAFEEIEKVLRSTLGSWIEKGGPRFHDSIVSAETYTKGTRYTSVRLDLYQVEG